MLVEAPVLVEDRQEEDVEDGEESRDREQEDEDDGRKESREKEGFSEGCEEEERYCVRFLKPKFEKSHTGVCAI